MSECDATKGSQRDIRVCFNSVEYRDLLCRRIGTEVSEWISPLEEDAFREYRDRAFLGRVGLSECAEALKAFWPNRGPVWDGLAKASDGTILLFEAKAHISEFFGMGSKASDKNSRERIARALKQAADYIRADFDESSWTDALYQTANRLAFLYFLNVKLKRKARLYYLIFLNDSSVASAKETQELWEQAIFIAERYILRLPSKGNAFSDGKKGSWRDWVRDVYIDVKEIGLGDGAPQNRREATA